MTHIFHLICILSAPIYMMFIFGLVGILGHGDWRSFLLFWTFEFQMLQDTTWITISLVITHHHMCQIHLGFVRCSLLFCLMTNLPNQDEFASASIKKMYVWHGQWERAHLSVGNISYNNTLPFTDTPSHHTLAPFSSIVHSSFSFLLISFNYDHDFVL